MCVCFESMEIRACSIGFTDLVQSDVNLNVNEMSAITDIDVLVSDNTAVDLLLFQYWLDGYSGKNGRP